MPSLGFWAPLIPEKTCLNSMVYSTEFQKGSNDEGDDDYLKCLSEESLDLSTLRKVCKECGIKADKLTRIDCISRLKSAIQSVANIDKLFFKIWQASGGILTGTCIHGIVYSFKCVLKAESPRDYADILLTMKHPPNIVLAAHINKRSPNFFDPYTGRVADPSEENIKAVQERRFQQISMTWLNRIKLKSVPQINTRDTKIHPITLVQQRFSLFDKFHQYNTEQEKEMLRRTSMVKELDGVVTETEEQLNSFLSKSIYFLDMLSPIHHYQMIKNILAVRNKVKNRNILQSLEKIGFGNFVDDEYGRKVFVHVGGDTQTVSLGNVAAVDIDESRTLQPTDVKMPLFRTSNDNDVENWSTPENAPFSLTYDDLKSLKRDAYVLGEVIDAMFVIFSAMLFNQNGTKVYIMPSLFFSQIDSDISLESLIPRDFVDVDFIVGASFFSRHWSLVLVNCRKEHIIYLGPIITRFRRLMPI